MTGIVYKSTGSWYTVKSSDGDFMDCRIKGKFRISGIKSTNPIAVGDVVDYEIDENSDARTGTINKIHTRKNYIVRKSVNLSHQMHIIASNIDQVFLLITINNPPTTFNFIDRFLVTAEAYAIETVLIFNKIDTFDEETLNNQLYMHYVYTQIGYKCMQTSAIEMKGIDNLKTMMIGKVSMFSGHSGVGKSTLVNALESSLDLKTKTATELGNLYILGTTENAVINTSTNRIIIFSFYNGQPHLLSLDANTGVIIETKLLQLPYNSKCLKNLVIDEENNSIYSLLTDNNYYPSISQKHTMYFAKLNATTLDFNYVNPTPIIGTLSYTACTYNKINKTYFFGDLTSISSINTLNGNYIKTDTLFKNAPLNEENRLVHMVCNNTTINNITNTSVSKNLKIYPNPAFRGYKATIEMRDFTNPTECRIYNNLGIMVHGFTLSQKIKQLNLQSFKPGNYFIKVGTEFLHFSIIE